MSDTPQGPGWWQASDDKWYPPPRPQMPGEEEATAVVEQQPTAVQPFAGPPPGAPPSGGFPAGPPTGSGQGFVPPGAGGPGVPGGPPSMPGQPGPYGMPGAQPGMAPQQNRTPLFIVLGVLVAAGLVGLIVLLTSGGGGDDPPATTTTEQAGGTTAGPATTGAPPTTVDSGGGGGGGGGTGSSGDLVVVDSGFSVYTDQLSEEQRFSYGYLVQNNGDSVATNVPVTVAFLDDAGTVIGTVEDVIWVLLPDQVMGLGQEPYDDASAIAEIQVTVGEPSSWESPDNYGELTASGITTTVDDYGAPTSSFTATSTYSEQVEPYSYVVYYNSAGDIVGGGFGTVNFVPPNGSSAGSVTSYSSIPDIDNSKTQVYLDPGYIS